jgi:hypothetical protein
MRAAAAFGISTVLVSWYGMQLLHEAGHVLHAWLSGGRVERLVFPLVGFSRTDLSVKSVNPPPQFVAWGGAIWGCILPLAGWGIARVLRQPFAFILRFLAGFCLIANGAYLAAGSFADAGDAADLMRHGAPRAALIAFGVVTAPLGLYLWHGLGPRFGLGASPAAIDPRVVTGLVVALAAVFALMLVIGR